MGLLTFVCQVTLEKVPGIIVDYSSREQSELDLVKEIEKASVICLVYAIDDEASKEKLCTYWLPKIQEVEESLSSIVSSSPCNSMPNIAGASSSNNNNKAASASHNSSIKRPIVIVANKMDSVVAPNVTQDHVISSLIVSHSQIETCVLCSARTLKNVPEVFYYAQKSVLYPTWPCYDVDKKKLTERAIKCLTRVFKLCDHDNDGLLNDKELNEFQIKSFGISLNSGSLREVKSLLNNNSSQGAAAAVAANEHLANNQITLTGFLFLHSLFFKKGRQETSWTVLKKFGYDRNLSLSRDYLNIK